MRPATQVGRGSGCERICARFAATWLRRIFETRIFVSPRCVAAHSRLVAAGLNYTLFERAKRSGEKAEASHREDWSVKELKLGAEVFGGLGDSALGLTLNPDVTQQYAELNLRSEFSNGMHVQVGGAFGLTKDTERDLVRVMFGYEFQ